MDAHLILFQPASSEVSAREISSWTPTLLEAGYTLESVASLPELLALLEVQPTVPVLIDDAAGVSSLEGLPESRLSHFLVVGQSFEEVHEWLEYGLTDFILLPLNATLLRGNKIKSVRPYSSHSWTSSKL